MDVSGELYISSACISSFYVVQVSGRTCYKSIQSSYSSGTMLDGGSLAFHSSQNVGRCFCLVSHPRRPHHRCFGEPGAQGSVIAAFNPLAAQGCVLHRQGLSSSISQVV